MWASHAATLLHGRRRRARNRAAFGYPDVFHVKHSRPPNRDLIHVLLCFKNPPLMVNFLRYSALCRLQFRRDDARS